MKRIKKLDKLITPKVVIILLLLLGIYLNPHQLVNKTEAAGEYSWTTSATDPPEFVWSKGELSAEDGELNTPYGGVVDSDGNLYVVDALNHRVQKFDSNGNFILTWGEYGSGAGDFNQPRDIAVDSKDNIYVADVLNNRIQKFDSSGNYISMYSPGQGSGPGEFDRPHHLIIDLDTDEIYVSDTYNSRIQKFDSSWNYITSWGGQGTGDGQFNMVRGIDIDSEGYIYASDPFNSRVQKFTSDGTFVTKWGTQGTGEGEFQYPAGIAIDSQDRIYVADFLNSRIEIFNTYGEYITEFGTFGTGEGEFNWPGNIAINPLNGTLTTEYIYIMDAQNHRIQKFDINRNFITLWGGYGSTEVLNQPKDIATDAQGNVYISDYVNKRIMKYNSLGEFQLQITPPGVSGGVIPWGIDIASNGNIYLVDKNPDDPNIIKLDSSGNYVERFYTGGIATGLSVDSQDYIYISSENTHDIRKYNSNGDLITQWGEYGTGDGQFYTPRAIATDSQDNVYVVDTFNYRIQKFDSSGNFITKWGSLGSEIGQFNYSGDSGTYYYCPGIAIDDEDNVYVTDSGNHRVQKFDSDGNFIVEWGGFTSDNEEGLFNGPTGIDLFGDSIYVVEHYSSRIQKFTIPAIVTLDEITPDPHPYTGLTFTGNLQDLTGISSLEYQIDIIDGTWSSCTADDGSFDSTEENFTCTPEPLETGSHTVYLRATDILGATTSSSDYVSDSFEIDPSIEVSINLDTVSVLDFESGDTGYGNSIAKGPDGFPRISYHDKDGDENLYLIVCHDKRCNNFDKVLVDEDSYFYPATSIAIGNDGFVRIVYPSYYGYVKYAKCTDYLCSSPVITTIDDSIDLDGYYELSLQIDSYGFARIAYDDYDTSKLYYAICNGLNCTDPNIFEIANDSYAYYGVDMILDSNDIPYFAYQSSDYGYDLEYSFCDDSSCPSINTSTIHSSGGDGYGVTMTLGHDGFPRFAFQDCFGEGLTYLKCNDVDCADTEEQTFGVHADYSSRVSLGLKFNDIPVIAYTRDDDYTMDFIECFDQNCSSYATTKIDTVDVETDKNYGKDLAIDSSEAATHVYISYYDYDNSALRFAYLLSYNSDAPIITPDFTSKTINTSSNNITGLVEDAVDTVSKVQYQVDSTTRGNWTECSALDGTFDESSEQFVCTVSGLSETTYTVYVRAIDELGNMTAVSSYTQIALTVDTTPPVLDIIDMESIYNASTPTLPGTVTDSISPISLVQYQMDSTSGEWSSCVSTDGAFDEISEDFTCQITPSLSDGSHTIYVRASDSAGNTIPNSNLSTDTFTVDTSNPTVRITDIGLIDDVLDRLRVLYYFTSTTAKIKGITESNSTVYFEYDEETYSTVTNGSGNFSITLDVSRGVNDIEYYAKDLAGNESLTKSLELIVGTENFPDWLLERLGLLITDEEDVEQNVEDQEEEEQIIDEEIDNKDEQEFVEESDNVVTTKIKFTDSFGKSLVRAIVEIEGETYVTDNNGEIYINNLEERKYEAKIRYEGKDYTAEILGSAGDNSGTVVVEETTFNWNNILKYIGIGFGLLILFIVIFAFIKKRKTKKKY
jgi:streptogramin lyase